jgi:glycine dehydrogenase subunit 2
MTSQRSGAETPREGDMRQRGVRAIGGEQGGVRDEAVARRMQQKLEQNARLRREGGVLRDYHAAHWDEPIVMELGRPGERGVIPPQAGDVAGEVPEAAQLLPAELRRPSPPALPEVGQPQLLRHYTRLSQMTLGVDVTVDIGEGTCTMKYSPKVNEQLARGPKLSELHPDQPEETLQGILEICHRMAGILCQISGLDEFSFQPAGGSAAAYGFAAMARRYFHERGEDERDEIVTTVFSHPCDGACPATAGYKVVTLMPGPQGVPELEQFRAALSERTAAVMITNPEDIGLFNPLIRQYTDAAHAAGALCYYDQANLNGIIGISRAREAGFDACHFNLHKTFSTPHGCKGPACGALGVSAELAPYLPAPHIVALADARAPGGVRYHLDYDRPHAVGKLRAFLGNLGVVLRAYAWTMSLGARGLREVAEVSVLNNSYLEAQLREVRGVGYPFAPGRRRLDQVRYSFGELKEETGFGTVDMRTRFCDFGLQTWFMSHHPWIVPEPFTPEPCESYSKDDIDYWAAAMKASSDDAYETPEHFAAAPHNQSCGRITSWERLEDPTQWAVTWRAYRRKHPAACAKTEA